MVGSSPVLVDTNAIIEAVRTSCWPAITGRFRVETVQECYDEALRGDATRPSYVRVAPADLERLSATHLVTDIERARLALAYEHADALDEGERDLFAHAHSRGDRTWVLCSPDKASVRAAVALDCADRLVSLERLAQQMGARPSPPLADHHSEARLSLWRTAALLGTL
jgi:hypothetical protein